MPLHPFSRSPARCLLRVAVLAAALVAVPAAGSGQTPAEVRDELARQFESSARKFVALAEAMPADRYTWSPAEGVMSVARVYMHVARYNYMYPEENLGIAAPMGAAAYDRWETEITDKDEAVRILRASMDHVRGVLDTMRDEELGARTRLYGREVGKWAVLLQLVAHMNEHLGQSIAYARMNGVVPPWSR